MKLAIPPQPPLPPPAGPAAVQTATVAAPRSGPRTDGDEARSTPPMGYWEWLRMISAYQAEAAANRPAPAKEPPGDQ